MDHAYFVRLQEKTLLEAVSLLKKDPGVVGIVLYGSMVKGLNDAFSDIDLICYLSAPGEATVGNLISQIGNIQPLLSKLWIYGKNSLFLFRNGIRLDLDFLPEADIRSIAAGSMKILHDPQGKVAGGLPVQSGTQPTHPKYFHPGEALIDWFFWMFRQVYCWVKRGAQNGPRSFEKLYAAFLSMNEMRQTLMEMRRWTLGTDGERQDDDPGFTANLSVTFTALRPVDMLCGTKALLAAFEFACPAYCDKCGTEYPTEKIETMKIMLDTFDSLD